MALFNTLLYRKNLNYCLFYNILLRKIKLYFQQTEHNKFVKYLPMLLLQQLSHGLSYNIEYGYLFQPYTVLIPIRNMSWDKDKQYLGMNE